DAISFPFRWIYLLGCHLWRFLIDLVFCRHADAAGQLRRVGCFGLVEATRNTGNVAASSNSASAATLFATRPRSVAVLSSEVRQDTPVSPAVGVPQPAFDRAFERVIAIDVQPPGIRMNPASK